MDTLDFYTALFAYPDEFYRARALACADATGSAEMRTFADAVEPLSLGQLQEAFIQAFDLNPASTLEIGWHLFGEQYERGEFLVDMRGRLREAGIPETGELPDHLLYVLPLMSRLEPEDARKFVEKHVRPALAKIEAGLPVESVFVTLVRSVSKALTADAADARTGAVPPLAAGPRAVTAEHAEPAEGAASVPPPRCGART
jgi:nitrate reductase molybdenum cofactor assembly chaperone